MHTVPITVFVAPTRFLHVVAGTNKSLEFRPLHASRSGLVSCNGQRLHCNFGDTQYLQTRSISLAKTLSLPKDVEQSGIAKRMHLGMAPPLPLLHLRND